MSQLSDLRTRIRHLHRAEETTTLAALAAAHGPDAPTRAAACAAAEGLIRDIRASGTPGLMEVFLAEYGLSSDEGVALMCLAEALLRVPDAATIDELIEDKIAPSAWGAHLGQSSSSLVNASTWALMLTGKVLQEPGAHGLADTLRSAVKRLGEPVIRTAVKRAMKEMGHQFVLGQTTQEAITRGKGMEKKGFTYSYDMLGEAALTARDAKVYYDAYADAITQLGAHAAQADTRRNPGISIKLSALHPRYELSQSARVMAELVPRVTELALMAKAAQMGLNIDAEESDRLDISLDVIEAVLRDDRLSGWDGFGVVVQAYGKRAPAVIDWLAALATELDRKIMVRLVKGAYWDTEIKQAQVDGVADFPVYTRKPATDVSYICCARKLLDHADRIYPQFATHNAHTVCAILEMGAPREAYEFQRLHGMGETLHKIVLDRHDTRCRIYAPVGAHSDLLAYLVRRLLENGANSSFVNQIVDEDVDPAEIAQDPFASLDADPSDPGLVTMPADLYQPERPNSLGWDLRNTDDVAAFHAARDQFKTHEWHVGPMIAGTAPTLEATPVVSPNDQADRLGTVALATLETAEQALAAARPWQDTPPAERCRILKRAADLYEEHAGEIFAALCREAGKTGLDAIAEIREAVDFLRYYGAEAIRNGAQAPRGIITCISPWNFPLAIFSGQIAAALAAGNGVLAKPADPTPITAAIGVRLMRAAGVPDTALQLVPGAGPVVGAKLTTDPRVHGICFTGSTGVAQTINRAAAATLEPDATLIAETGGLNAMIVDSTALPEQAIRDIVDSAFRSCGQRCSALRILYLQKDIAEGFLEMLYGAMDELEVSHPWNLSSDLGPVITRAARQGIATHVETARKAGRLLKQLDVPQDGLFIGPAVIRVDGIADLEREVFGPVLHVCTFEADEIDSILKAINGSGYGLTFGLHTRIDDRVEHITSRLKVGNLYVNRNQIGAVVGSQPFGGEGLSGTGPKAGGPKYVQRFKRLALPDHRLIPGDAVDPLVVQAALDARARVTHAPLETRDMPGPTGESNRWSLVPRGTILCLGPSLADMTAQMEIARRMGCPVLGIALGAEGPDTLSGVLPPAALETLRGFAAVALWADRTLLTEARKALAARQGAILPLIATDAMAELCTHERHLCIDTTAAGGNASLLAAQ
ncbi:bifunctional proline dehydrogenase/L-glutamate gamma-semialdehyde dehydrogenase PutA [Dinoroseobacter sp. S124A]|uniref:bifunctional proline dehydrogenase/L-glutamate gamma-semialdehyde dehydrogenase PutA n=1 Tax=Dinoroseobacter sp. S124A TaxID=3415128 RepID=UPI003C7C6803